MNQLEELNGIVDHFIFKNDENGFSVFVLQVTTNRKITVKGYTANINPGEQVSLHGSWVNHPKFGKQFEAQTCTACLPTTTTGLKKYLGSGLIKGIGPVYAEKLVTYFGTNVLEIIDKQPSRLQEISGIGTKRITKIINAWHDQKEISTIMVFLQEKGISTTCATKIYKKYKQDSIAVLNENPYQLVDDIWGIGFKTADQIAHNLGIEKDSIRRVRAGIIYSITTELDNGHLYCELSDLKNKIVKLLELDRDIAEPIVKEALHNLYHSEKIKLISYDEHHLITLSQYYFSEKGFAHKIKMLLQQPLIRTFDSDTIYKKLRAPNSSHDIALNEDQQRGILACVQNKVTIITGGPGTGKTTLIKKLLTVLDDHKCMYRLAAPTGRAAKRITEGTGRHATTLHRLLAFDFTTMRFTHNEKNALKLDFLIIDEASMIDIFLAHSILKALPLHAHLILIGDVDQLPSVGAGNVLNDLIASNVVPTIHLKEIFRQAQDSLIIVNAHRVNNGEFPTTSAPGAKRDFLFLKEDNPENVSHHLRTIIHHGLQKFSIQAHESIVLSPMNRGIIGTQQLNHELQTLLNPKTSENQFSYAGTLFKIGDRVMQMRNNYDKNVFNGDTGFITSIDLVERVMIIRYDDRDISYDFSELDELVLAYAISIHKSQGSEYAATIIPVFMNHFILLQRNLLYTAITRSKKLCILIGQPKAIAIAIKNTKGIARKTLLTKFLTCNLHCR